MDASFASNLLPQYVSTDWSLDIAESANPSCTFRQWTHRTLSSGDRCLRHYLVDRLPSFYVLTTLGEMYVLLPLQAHFASGQMSTPLIGRQTSGFLRFDYVCGDVCASAAAGALPLQDVLHSVITTARSSARPESSACSVCD